MNYVSFVRYERRDYDENQHKRLSKREKKKGGDDRVKKPTKKE